MRDAKDGVNEWTDLPVVLVVVGVQLLEEHRRVVLLSVPCVHLGSLEDPGEGALSQTLPLARAHTHNDVRFTLLQLYF